MCKLKYLKALNIITLQNYLVMYEVYTTNIFYLVMYEVYTTNIFKLKDLRPIKLACSLLPSCLNVFLRQKFNGIIFSVCQHHQYKFSKNQFTSLIGPRTSIRTLLACVVLIDMCGPIQVDAETREEDGTVEFCLRETTFKTLLTSSLAEYSVKSFLNTRLMSKLHAVTGIS